ncbi:MAG: polysaccharide pyruvyl transferase family protein, partial [candidate division Zixibacteria bacterium]|nr:polysaccharide pyruvyl transferase family protein [candidate division Zixibacteria bacterium]
GDEAILSCMLTKLRELKLNADYVVYSGDPEETTRTHKVAAVHNILPTSVKSFLIRALGRNRKNFYETLKAFRRTTVFIVGGGGLFYDHPDSNIYLLELLTRIKRAKKFDKKVVLFGVGFGPVYLEHSKKKLNDILNRVDLITVRDEESRKLVEELGIVKPDIHTTADFVYFLKSASDIQIDKILEKERIALSRRPLIGLCLCCYSNEHPAWKKSLVGFCRYALENLNADLLFIPMQTGGGFDDRVSARAIIDELKNNERIFSIEGQYSPQETMGLMARCNMILGERFHGVILSLNNRVPVFGLSYKPKVERLFKEIGHEDWFVRLDEMTPEALIEGFRKIWDVKETLDDELQKGFKLLENKALRNFTLLVELLQKKP